MTMLNILIADDHPIFLKGLKEVIETDPGLHVTSAVADGKEALQVLLRSTVDVAVLDLDMPHLNGLQVAEETLAVFPALPIILLTMHKEKAHFIRALEVGIMGYVLKENAAIDVIHAIHKVAGGHVYISPEMSTFLLKKSAKQVERKGAESLRLLTPAETQILKLIGDFKSSKEMADLLFISERTVNNHRMNIAKKLGLSGKNSLLRFAMDHH